MGSTSTKTGVTSSRGATRLTPGRAIAEKYEGHATATAASTGDEHFRVGLADSSRGTLPGSVHSPRFRITGGSSGIRSPRVIIRAFAPNWFSVTMGTGVLALALNQLPLPVPGIRDLAGGLWLLDSLLFVLFSVLYTARWILFFDEALRMLRHPILSMFLGAIPMGLATIFAMNRVEGPITPLRSNTAEDALITRPDMEVAVRLLPPGGLRS